MARVLLIADNTILRGIVQRSTDGIVDGTAGRNEAYFAYQDEFLNGAKPDLE